MGANMQAQAEQAAELLKALSNPQRLRVIMRLGLGPFFVRLLLVKLWAKWSTQIGQRAPSRAALMA